MMLPLLYQIKLNYTEGVRRALIAISWIFAIGIGVFYNCHLYYFPLFATGYFINDWMRMTDFSWRHCCMSFMLLITIASIRIIMRYFFDGTLFYDFGIVPICMSVISLDIIVIVYETCWLEKDLLASIIQNKLFHYLDFYNFYIYIVHYFWVPLVYENFGYFYGTFVFTIAIYCSAIIVRKVDKAIQNCIC